MSERTSLAARVWSVACKLNVSKTAIEDIIKSYLEFCKEELRSRHRVTFAGIASVVPDNEVFDYRETFAYKCMRVSVVVSQPVETVTQVIRGYIDTVREDIENGKSANIFGIMTITPYIHDGEISRIHSSISQTLQSDLMQFGSHARVYTNRIFSRAVKGVVSV